ncbi:DNA replication licensing factor mcm10 [Escovopsis weberi]|uniref:DNA replication licensing factor mcm10 n=1 Tax=Escovopsis weberi TaxID=150374 RepID=A0A0N0RUA8_ESCWE|nr:DNA replication licensing factor mcm10 [Escovopsis weberi]
MEEYKKKAVDIPDEPLPSRSFTRDEIVGKPRSDSSSATLASSQTAPSFRSVSGMSNTSDSTNNTSSDPKSSSVTVDSVGEQSTSFEPYSSFHLSKRILPHRVLARHVSGKKTFNIKDLLRTVKAPDFALPDIEQDLVVFAVVAKKSEPRSHKPSAVKGNQPQEDPRKYMVLNLVDLEYELDLFLFNTGFNRYWKLTEGTVVAILNPSVMPPPPGRQDTGRFSLVINSDEDTILEIGAARDLGFCQAIKKDGSLCSAWVNKRRTQYCEFHSNEAVRKQRSTRMEVNTQGFGGRDRYKSHSQQSSMSKEPFEFGQSASASASGKKKTDNYDWETKTQWFVSKTHSAADLIDGKDRSAADRRDKAEFLKRSLEAKEREREMMKKLGQIGHAAGKEYMQRSAVSANINTNSGSGSAKGNGKSNSDKNSATHAPGTQAGAQGLGPIRGGFSADAADEPVRPGIASLFLDKEREIHLSPIKRKRTGSSNAGSISSVDQNGAKEAAAAAAAAAGKPGGGGGLGWGSGLREKLSNMRDGEKLKPEQPPLRKKTRFVTDKGIREAGRESLGNLAERQIMLGDDIDDELIIVN